MNEEREKRAGLVVLAGRPNVGKSTLLNALVGEKVSIVTPKPQTTRHRIVGVLTRGHLQIGFVDTPGLHGGRSNALNRRINETTRASLDGVDLALMLVEADRWQPDDDAVLEAVRRSRLPVGLVINKIDRLARAELLLPFIEACSKRHAFDFFVPMSARREKQFDPLLKEIEPYVPPADEFLFPEDEFTDRSVKFLIEEAVREKFMLLLRDELPYSLSVTADNVEAGPERIVAHATVWVARDSHKAIVIGRGGATLKEAGQRARLELAARFDTPCELRLHVKLRQNWNESDSALRELGY